MTTFILLTGFLSIPFTALSFPRIIGSRKLHHFWYNTVSIQHQQIHASSEVSLMAKMNSILLYMQMTLFISVQIDIQKLILNVVFKILLLQISWYRYTTSFVSNYNGNVNLKITQMHISTPVYTPFRSGQDIDTIPPPTKNPSIMQQLIHILRTMVGSLLQLSGATCPDLVTATASLSQYIANPSPGHIKVAKYFIK